MAIFFPPVVLNFTSGGLQKRETKNRRLWTIVASFQDSKPREKVIAPTFSFFVINNALLYHLLANWLAHNKKMTEKSVFREAWSPEMTSKSFPVSCFCCFCFCWLRCVPSHCITLRCVALRCIAFYCILVNSIAFYCILVHWIVLHSIVVRIKEECWSSRAVFAINIGTSRSARDPF